MFSRLNDWWHGQKAAPKSVESKSTPAESLVQKSSQDLPGELTIYAKLGMLKCTAKGPALYKPDGELFTITGDHLDRPEWSMVCPKKVEHASFTTKNPSEKEIETPGRADLNLGSLGQYNRDAVFKCKREKGVIKCDAGKIDGIDFSADFSFR